MKSKRTFVPILITAFTILLGLGVLMGGLAPERVSAAPPAAPTPVASLNLASGWSGDLIWYDETVVVTGTAYGSAPINIANFELADVQYVIDQGTTNTVTLTLQLSNNGVDWVTGTTLVAANAADASVLSQVPLFGKFARVLVDATNTNPLTVTVIGVGK